MKKDRFFGAICKALVIPAFMLSSCNYLDVLPPETVGPEDTMKDNNAVYDFLLSCYTAVESCKPTSYTSYESSTDEFSQSELWNQKGQQLLRNQFTPSNVPNYWEQLYGYIGQCHLFLRELGRNAPVTLTDAAKREYGAEAEFLKAYYHFRLLNFYGPIPVISEYASQDIPTADIPGRSHYDYVVDYIVNTLDSVAPLLPATRDASTWSRATSCIAKAIKSRVLLYAASPLWNGSFPFPDWKNTSYETPGYGNELVSSKKDPSKWQRALDAALDAIKEAENAGGHELFSRELGNQMAASVSGGLPLNFIPGVDETVGTDVEKAEALKFKETVQALRYMMASMPDKGNKEFIWAVNTGDATTNYACLPRNVCHREGDQWHNGWTCENPTLYSVEHFNTKNGLLPKFDPEFPNEAEWLTSANIPDHGDIIKLNANREPRFYAWFSFDGDMYSPIIRAGGPLWMNIKRSEDGYQGYAPTKANRDYSTTGYFTKKWFSPELRYNSNGGNNRAWPHSLIRLAELYLNAAECYAELGQNDKALEYVNVIRERAGVRGLTTNDLQYMSAVDWVRNERFIELWGEGHRYYDLRRWMLAPTHLKSGVIEGLNSKVENADFETFNQRRPVLDNYIWLDRMYMMPVKSSEVYANPQMVQAPGY